MADKLSHTAAFITVKFFGLTLKEPYRSLFDPEIIRFYESMVQQLPAHLKWYEKSLKSKWWRSFFIWWEELLLPGDLMHIIGRKYYIIQEMEKALNNGYKQVVVLGSGFDHSAWMCSCKGIHSFEIDTEYMISTKKNYLLQSELNNEYLHLLSLDVSRENIAEVLERDRNFDPQLPTVFVAEGFFDYLNLQTTRDVLQQITQICEQTALISTVFSLDELNAFHRSSFTSGVAMVGEAIKLPLSIGAFRSLLEEHGFKEKTVISYHDMEEELFKTHWIPYSVLDGFYVVSSE
jgi:methyltransferase (TIGR00027 family)